MHPFNGIFKARNGPMIRNRTAGRLYYIPTIYTYLFLFEIIPVTAIKPGIGNAGPVRISCVLWLNVRYFFLTNT